MDPYFSGAMVGSATPRTCCAVGGLVSRRCQYCFLLFWLTYDALYIDLLSFLKYVIANVIFSPTLAQLAAVLNFFLLFTDTAVILARGFLISLIYILLESTILCVLHRP